MSLAAAPTILGAKLEFVACFALQYSLIPHITEIK